MVCAKCGKTIEGEGMAFCPYCGEKLPGETEKRSTGRKDPEAEKWIAKALGVSSYPERKKILLKGKEAVPDSREIDWELLFIGEEPKKHGKVYDFSVIKSWVLEIYLNPESFTEERRDEMRAELFNAPELRRVLSLFEDPEKKQREYIRRLCREYVEIFLEGNSKVMGSWFGFQIDRNREKKLARPAAEMIRRIRADEKLLPEQREQLWQALYEAYAAKVIGKTEYIDEYLRS